MFLKDTPNHWRTFLMDKPNLNLTGSESETKLLTNVSERGCGVQGNRNNGTSAEKWWRRGRIDGRRVFYWCVTGTWEQNWCADKGLGKRVPIWNSKDCGCNDGIQESWYLKHLLELWEQTSTLISAIFILVRKDIHQDIKDMHSKHTWPVAIYMYMYLAWWIVVSR